MKVFSRTNKGVQCTCGAILKPVQQWEYYTVYVCPGCYLSVYCNFDPDKNHIFEDSGCEQIVMLDIN